MGRRNLVIKRYKEKRVGGGNNQSLSFNVGGGGRRTGVLPCNDLQRGTERVFHYPIWPKEGKGGGEKKRKDRALYLCIGTN